MSPSLQEEYLPAYEESTPPEYGETDIELGSGYKKFPQDLKEPVPSYDFNESFRLDHPKWNDLPFVFVFLVSVVCFCGVFTYSTNNITVPTLHVNESQSQLMLIVAITAVAATYAGILLLKARPTAFIRAGFIMNIFMALGFSYGAFTNNSFWTGVFFGFVALIHLLWLIDIRRRAAFSALILKTVVEVAQRNPSTWKISFAGSVAAFVFSLLSLAALYGTLENWGPDDSGVVKDKASLVIVGSLLMFTSAYIAEVMKSVLHSTVAGIYGSWYYLSQADQCPRNSGSASFKRTITYSLGSVCFGSLIVTVIQTLNNLAALGKHWAAQEGGLAGYIGFYILEMVISVFEAMVRWINEYAYSLVALYGLDFLHAARGAFYVVEQKGLTAIVNDCLINTALGVYSLFVAYACALVSLVFVCVTEPAWAQNAEGALDVNATLIMILFAAAAFGFFVANTATSVIHSGTITFFITLAKNPEVFKVTHPEQYAQILESYPDVQNKLETDF
ncbi:hypothetical protein OGAPHI_004060 [Ogataea philodendri]|uniref:Protein PNS1 n=1 Tax=Ogataea philodendri TaxID=1378263 RepID=A0A9P8T5F9_9ASCO|nr:uncharacterized protein OGAPHI_004060 [Ogataea philodendri]KAH3665871.1 hypothetical protein OGAPHI_004060 [Ogataea philodendri]